VSFSFVQKHRRAAAASCFSSISSILSRNMNLFQESQWRAEQRNLALLLASAFKNRCFRRSCAARASDRHRALAQTRIASAFRSHFAKSTLRSKRNALRSLATLQIHHQFLRHSIRRSVRSHAAAVIQNAWRVRLPHQLARDLKRELQKRQTLTFARYVLIRLFKLFAAQLALRKARNRRLQHLKMAAIAEQNQRTGCFAIRLQCAMRCARARKLYSFVVKQHNSTKIQSFYRAHIARNRVQSASAHEDALLIFKTGYRFSIFGISGFVPKIRINLGALVHRCAVKLQSAWRGRAARLLIARCDRRLVHASARRLQFSYVRHYHFDW
jgi:hypothetical protein